MPNWMSAPPQLEDSYAHRIVRTPPDRPLIAIATSEYPAGCPTHFANNRTVPCEGEAACEACDRGLSFRWHGYCGAIVAGTHEHILFEYTSPVAKTFANYIQKNHWLRGCHFKAWRPGGRPNSRVVIACTPCDQTKYYLPPSPKIGQILCHIWGVPYNGEEPVYCAKPQHREIHVEPGNGDARYPTTPLLLDKIGKK